MGEERYRTAARYWTGADLDPAQAYAWGWSEYQSLRAEMRAEADRVLPGISYKLGERAWLDGRQAPRAARGSDFDLKAWHMAALSLGSLGLDDLTGELASL